MSTHTSVHSLAAAQAREAVAAEGRRQTWAAVAVAALLGLAAGVLFGRD